MQPKRNAIRGLSVAAIVATIACVVQPQPFPPSNDAKTGSGADAGITGVGGEQASDAGPVPMAPEGGNRADAAPPQANDGGGGADAADAGASDGGAGADVGTTEGGPDAGSD